MAIKSFARKPAEEFFYTDKVPRRAGWAPAAAVTRRKLDMLDYAARVEDLRAPPGNRLEKLRGEWRGYWSIRVNDQGRIVFRWNDGPEQVDIVDYH